MAQSNYRLIAGLGNPGNKYHMTRHNAGFLVADELRTLQSGTTPKMQFDGELSEISYQDNKIYIFKPQRYMNLSGEPLRACMDFYKISAAEIIVVHDELDLPFGAVRIKYGGGDGGHNGLKSISAQLGTKDFARVRLGIGRPPVPGGEGADVSSWVLGRFSPDHTGIRPEEFSSSLSLYIRRGVDACLAVVGEGVKTAQNRFH